MQYLNWLVVAFSLLPFSLIAQDNWQQTLKTQLEQMEKASPEKWPPHVKTLKNLAEQNPGEWLLQYYAGWAATQLSFRSSKSDAESLCDQAEPFVKRALELQPENTETLTLMGYWLSARINAVPTRGATLGEESRKYAEKGIAANPDNPRAWLVKALNIYYTPKLFGGGKQKAKSAVDTAGDKFARFKPSNALAPNWGQQVYDMLLANYK